MSNARWRDYLLSKRLRNTLFVWWKHEDPEGKEDFELYYGKMMNRIIESIKKRLPEK
jgi:hypothetical protein